MSTPAPLRWKNFDDYPQFHAHNLDFFGTDSITAAFLTTCCLSGESRKVPVVHVRAKVHPASADTVVSRVKESIINGNVIYADTLRVIFDPDFSTVCVTRTYAGCSTPPVDFISTIAKRLMQTVDETCAIC